MLHPFAPADQQEGYAGYLSSIFRELEADLCEITGFAAHVSLQPNSGSPG